jgi:hypothetical protein
MAAIVAAGASLAVQAASGGLASIGPTDLRTWLTYLASDELQGRGVFMTGSGLAAAYIESHLKSWNVKPAGGNGSYLQTVRVLGVKSTSRSSVTVVVGGERRTFADGQGVTFPRNAGAKRTFTVDRVEFVGYGLDAPGRDHEDYRGKDVRGAAVVWLGPKGPPEVDEGTHSRLLNGRGRYATEQRHAAASLGPAPAQSGPGRGGQGTPPPAATADAGSGGGIPRPDFTTVQRLDAELPPVVSASEDLLEFLFSAAPTGYADLKRDADAKDPLPSFRLEGVSITFNIDVDYEVVRTQLAQNVVGIVEGSDPQLKDTYVALGAHYDHVGYAEGEVTSGDRGPRRAAAPGRVTSGVEQDRIWNGADDDGSGSVALLALARAFAEGERPRRSLLFVWHTGEERGLWGSRYFADYPEVPLDRIVAQLNMDMIGRNRDNKASESDTVYLIGSDRISSELDSVARAANSSLARPLRLDYEFNDPADLEQLYFRSDHYSYAAKGIPIIFYTTGLHPDYHANTDEVSKIEFEKLARITQLVYATGERLANLDHAPERDNKGPRAGKQK